MPAQRLTLIAVFAHASVVVQVFLFLLLVLLIAAVAVWVGQLGGRRTPRGETILSSVLVAAPLFGLTAAAYGLLNMSIGLANVRPTPDLATIAPGLAEASLCILLGLLAASLAAGLRAHLRFADRAA
ncbi:MotA/TolQ/ExbB proton channel family protein [Phenylobacterium sp.]|uniref:MotA/TolQ/ExbB proton channel family protein n=1 Tax=Phenylobacterium sp. TaxID=1871053 RepID=UPI0026028A2B|nr:MotA/TolQ/ExbB proton channel family protein [Phenylobacterium sp.]